MTESPIWTGRMHRDPGTGKLVGFVRDIFGFTIALRPEKEPDADGCALICSTEIDEALRIPAIDG